MKALTESVIREKKKHFQVIKQFDSLSELIYGAETFNIKYSVIDLTPLIQSSRLEKVENCLKKGVTSLLEHYTEPFNDFEFYETTEGLLKMLLTAKAEQNDFLLVGDMTNHLFKRVTYTRKMIELCAFILAVIAFLAQLLIPN